MHIYSYAEIIYIVVKYILLYIVCKIFHIGDIYVVFIVVRYFSLIRNCKHDTLNDKTTYHLPQHNQSSTSFESFFWPNIEYFTCDKISISATVISMVLYTKIKLVDQSISISGEWPITNADQRIANCSWCRKNGNLTHRCLQPASATVRNVAASSSSSVACVCEYRVTQNVSCYRIIWPKTSILRGPCGIISQV